MANPVYDYVIVGAGSAGCALAGRLAEDPGAKVCLLEAGPPDDGILVRTPLGLIAMTRIKRNWHFWTEPQAALDNRRLYWPRGKTLGGSSSINAMVYMRGQGADYDRWAALGNRGWAFRDLLPLFKRAQNQERGGSEFHGVGGPLNVADLRSPNLLSQVFIDAGQQLQLPHNVDFNGAVQDGVGFYQVTQKGGERCSSARAYLGAARPNLSVITNARASAIVMDGKRAVGVRYRHNGADRRAEAAREVVLAGGAINSPQLLMLSGIGPQAELERHGIPLRHQLPGVGRNLQDHLDICLVQRGANSLSIGYSLRGTVATAKAIYQYATARTGMLTSNVAEAGGFARTDSTQAMPDVQFHFLPAMIDDHGRRTLLGHGYSVHTCALRPASRGAIGLKSADPLADPLIQPNYLSAGQDLDVLIKGFKLARRILAAPAFAPHRGAELFPGEAVQSDREIESFIRRKAETIYHPVGTCKMGADDMAVVDDALRVHGVAGLRVVDASIMPTIVGGNTNAPAIMIAEKAFDLMRAAA